ncbi:MAG: hypothetical protein PUB58_08930 [Clostridiales bacterium]|nr:hypothetical protein [Clostridiales bacterium]
MAMKAILSFALGLCIFSVSFFTPASAVSGYYFNGGCRRVTNKGAAATIETQNPYVFNGSSVSAWAMTCDSSYSNRYAQVGYVKFYGDTAPKYFYEYSYGSSGTWFQKTLGTASTGSHNEFMVGCDNHTMYFKINGIVYGTVALTSIPFTRNTVEILAETHAVSDQSPGSGANPVSMGGAKYKTTSDSWVSASCTNSFAAVGVGYGSLTTQRNNIPSAGATNWEVWDSRY